MEITLEERKKYLEAHNEEIKEYSLKSVEDLIQHVREGTKGKVSEETLNKIYSKERREQEFQSQYEEVVEYILNKKTYNHEETINEINLKPYLEKIRHDNKKENVLYLLIKNNEVAFEKVKSEKAGFCEWNDAYIFKKAQELKADLIIIHNHPLSISAEPSGLYSKGKDGLGIGDARVWRFATPQIEKEYGINIIDEAVVTEYDYFSFTQAKIEKSK